MKIYTKTGDAGDTGLFGGGRVSKDHPRVEAYGDVDELNAALGMARSVEMMPRIDEVLVPIQRDLFSLGALLATPHPDKVTQQLQKARIDEGGSPSSSARSTRAKPSSSRSRRSSFPAALRKRQPFTSRAPSAAAPSGASSRSRARWTFRRS